MGEMNHRSKNLLSVILSVIRQTSKTGDLVNLPERIVARISALAANQDLLVRNLWRGIDVDDLVLAQLSHYQDLFDTRVTVKGPSVTISPSAAQGIGMALHELATNAGKYGALSNNEGQLIIQWSIGPDFVFSMLWQESGGPEVVAPTHAGFGQTVIGRMAEASVNGRVDIDYHPKGLRWSLTAPLDGVLHKITDS
jgi:two-component sensor histidine kinase